MSIRLTFILFFMSHYCSGAIFYVGPSRSFTVPSQVMTLVQNGDSVLIDAGDYYGDVGVWNADNLVIKGLGGVAHLHADGNNAQGKAIWVIKGDTTYINQIEFSECQVPDHNGAGIRHEGKMLTIVNCSFHHNEMGILTLSQNPGDHILIAHSEFYENGFGDGFSHSIYVNHSASLTVRYCYFHEARIGHHIKSRASKHLIEYNHIMDGSDGNSSRHIDLPNGGNTIIRGNLLIQGAMAENGNIIGYGLEGLSEPTNYFLCINNTIVSYRHAATFFAINGLIDTALVANNIIAGPGNLVQGQLYFENMICTGDIDSVGFENPGLDQYYLTTNSIAVDQGFEYGNFNGLSLFPQSEYVYELQGTNRVTIGIPDLGAHEFHPASASSQIQKTSTPLFYPSVAVDRILFYKSPKKLQLIEVATGRLVKIDVAGMAMGIQNLSTGWYVVRVGNRSQRFLKI